MKIRDIYIIILSIVLFSCNENVDQKERDLKKYPWLTPFVQTNIKDFEGKLNIDLGILEFSFQESPKTKTLSKFDTIAKNEQWKVIKKDQLKRVFSKVVPEDLKDGETTINIHLDTVSHKLHFRID